MSDPQLIADLDQGEAAIVGDLLRKAAQYDGMELHEASYLLMVDVLSTGSSPLGLAAAVAVMTLRLRRATQAGGTDG